MWERHLVGGTVAELHDRELPLDRRSVWVMEPSVPTLVLGSAQRAAVVPDAAAASAGWAITRRRSGGGLVALDPAEVVWVDVVVPRGDRLWNDDVGVAFEWLGDAWVRALGSLGVSGESHRGRPIAATAGRIVCFAGVGSGEVIVGGAKLVGLSQRRTRHGARFQCLVHLRWQPERWWHLLDPGTDTEPAAVAAERVRGAVTALGDVVESPEGIADLVVAGLVSELLALE